MGDDEWMARGRCRDFPSDMFFPTSARGVAQARRVCQLCEVKDVCLEYALAYGVEHGMWGGRSERERRRMRRARREGVAVTLTRATIRSVA